MFYFSDSDCSDTEEFILNEDDEFNDISTSLSDLNDFISRKNIKFETALNLKRDESDESQIKYFVDENIDFKTINYGEDNYVLNGQSKNSSMLWTTKQPKSNKRLKKDILKLQPGLTVCSRNIVFYLDSFTLFFTDEITSLILKYTNQSLEIHRLKEQKTSDSLYQDISREELLAYYGLLLTMGLNRDNKTPIDRLRLSDKLMVGSIYNLVMSRQRFKIIHRFLRFDNILTSNERKKEDKLAKVSEMMNMFNLNCQRSLNTEESVTIDEQILKLL